MEDNNTNLVEIPKVFHSFSSEMPFDHCIECDKYLLGDDSEYFIEKAIKNYQGFKAQDVIFEYAICLDCAEKLRKQISKESMQSIENYFADNMDLPARMQVMQNNPGNPEAWMEKCMLKGESQKDSEEYQIYAHCKGNHMELAHMPYMICGAALDEIAELLSEQTLDELDNFLKNHFGPPPELKELLPSKRRLVLV
ncbi:hypothetical protein LVD15_14310 [Fulvivirga maritima]|uniref:hypothetical protein n=1 Tax=Fulvivirga maritima TaxID=2904247 RepID=UPI001F316FEA|nr:hypothetical protein [Fulvivirga maritima]UII24496.1 hypothetical protein LVD15_14310 [Fulvivirga maritima]